MTDTDFERAARAQAAPRVYRWAIQMGWTPQEAGNLAAFGVGIPVADGDHALGSWRPPEIATLLFLRDQYRVGRWRG